MYKSITLSSVSWLHNIIPIITSKSPPVHNATADCVTLTNEFLKSCAIVSPYNATAIAIANPSLAPLLVAAIVIDPFPFVIPIPVPAVNVVTAGPSVPPIST